MMGGQPWIRGLRMPVPSVVAMVADGVTVDEILSPRLCANGHCRCVVRREVPRRQHVIVANLDAVGADLDEGAIVVLSEDWIRIRRLPIG